MRTYLLLPIATLASLALYAGSAEARKGFYRGH